LLATYLAQCAFVLGIGLPGDSPTALEGLAVGAAFISPYEQHATLHAIGRGSPCVYAVNFSIVWNVTQAVRSSLQHRFASCVPEQNTFAATRQRFSAALRDDVPPPLLTRLRLVSLVKANVSEEGSISGGDLPSIGFELHTHTFQNNRMDSSYVAMIIAQCAFVLDFGNNQDFAIALGAAHIIDGKAYHSRGYANWLAHDRVGFPYMYLVDFFNVSNVLGAVGSSLKNRFFSYVPIDYQITNGMRICADINGSAIASGPATSTSVSTIWSAIDATVATGKGRL